MTQRPNDRTELYVHVLTWNVASNLLTVSDVQRLFESGAVRTSDCLSNSDVVVVGLQEAYQGVQTTLASFVPVMGSDATVELFSGYLAQKGYVRLAACRTMGIVTMAFARRQLLIYVQDVAVCATRTGFGGWLGNKGAVGVRFTLGDLGLCFANCHLSAHAENSEKRAAEIQSILNEQVFETDRLPPTGSMEHDVVVLFGDLNYRLEGRPFDDVVRMVRDDQIQQLLVGDQLRLEQIKRQAGRSNLNYFMEMPITFPPTYKYTPGTDEFGDGGKGLDGHVPSWCDRILWFVHERRYPKLTDSSPQSIIRGVFYGIHGEPKLSDHRAVSGGLRMLADMSGMQPRVVFHLQAWQVRREATVTFDVFEGTVVSFWDWIALYPAKFAGEKDCVYWCFTPATRGLCHDGQSCSFIIGAMQMPSQEGSYVFVYRSAHYARVVGMSPAFPVINEPSTSEMPP